MSPVSSQKVLKSATIECRHCGKQLEANFFTTNYDFLYTCKKCRKPGGKK